MFHLTKTTPYSNVQTFYQQNYESSDEEIMESLRENITITPEMLSNYQVYSEEIRNVMINSLRLEWWEATGHDCFLPRMVGSIPEKCNIVQWINLTYENCKSNLPEMINYAKEMERLFNQ